MTETLLPEPVIKAWPTLSWPASRLIIHLAINMPCAISRNDLMSSVGIRSRNTFAVAMHDLIFKGLVVRKRGRVTSFYDWPEGCNTGSYNVTPDVTITDPPKIHKEIRNETTTPVERNLWSGPPPLEVKTWWNDEIAGVFKGIKPVLSIKAGRWKKFQVRHGEGLWDSRAKIKAAVNGSDFLQGKNSGHGKYRDWRMSFDWLVANETNWIKVLEGKYSGSDEYSPSATQQAIEQTIEDKIYQEEKDGLERTGTGKQ